MSCRAACTSVTAATVFGEPVTLAIARCSRESACRWAAASGAWSTSCSAVLSSDCSSVTREVLLRPHAAAQQAPGSTTRRNTRSRAAASRRARARPGRPRRTPAPAARRHDHRAAPAPARASAPCLPPGAPRSPPAAWPARRPCRSASSRSRRQHRAGRVHAEPDGRRELLDATLEGVAAEHRRRTTSPRRTPCMAGRARVTASRDLGRVDRADRALEPVLGRSLPPDRDQRAALPASRSARS